MRAAQSIMIGIFAYVFVVGIVFRRFEPFPKLPIFEVIMYFIIICLIVVLHHKIVNGEKSENQYIYIAYYMLSVIILVLTFGTLFYKNIPSQLGGGKAYTKTLVLQENNTQLTIKNAKIIYESNDWIYYEKHNTIVSIPKKNIIKLANR